MEEERPEGPEDDPPSHAVVIIFAVFFEAGLAPFSLALGWWGQRRLLSDLRAQGIHDLLE